MSSVPSFINYATATFSEKSGDNSPVIFHAQSLTLVAGLQVCPLDRENTFRINVKLIRENGSIFLVRKEELHKPTNLVHDFGLYLRLNAEDILWVASEGGSQVFDCTIFYDEIIAPTGDALCR